MKDIIDNVCFVIPLDKLRRTPNVDFDTIPMVENLSALDMVEHQKNAYSPTIE